MKARINKKILLIFILIIFYGSFPKKVLASCNFKTANYIDELSVPNSIKNIDKQNINFYLNFIVEQLFIANKYFNDQEPWKKKDDKQRLNTIIYVSLEIIRKISISVSLTGERKSSESS